MNIPLFKPSIGEEELQALKKTFESGWIGLGPNTYEFERRFAEYIGVDHALGLNSATAALHLALAVHGIEGGEVISPSLTFVSTNHAIMYNGGIPVFTDVDPDTLCLDPDAIKKNITDGTKAIITVHYGGQPSEMDEINEIARDHGIVVIEDAAHATGASYHGRKVGTLGDIACFSFQALKSLTTGEGGMVTTNDPEIHERMKLLRWMGIDKDTFSRVGNKEYSWNYEVRDLGFKCHMNDIPATIGMVQLKRLDGYLNHERRRVAERYNERLGKLDWVKVPVDRKDSDRVYCIYAIQVEKDRDALMSFMKERGIGTGVHYLPNHHHPYYRDLINEGRIPKPEVPVTEDLWKRIISLPLFAELSNDEVDYVCATIEAFGEQKG
jgi:perosamine synthetase